MLGRKGIIRGNFILPDIIYVIYEKKTYTNINANDSVYYTVCNYS